MKNEMQEKRDDILKALNEVESLNEELCREIDEENFIAFQGCIF